MATKKTPTKSKQGSKSLSFYKRWTIQAKKRRAAFLKRRPHRSFRLTKRRDVPSKVKIPGVIAHTVQVVVALWKWRKTFGTLIFVGWVSTSLTVGVSQQSQYLAFRDATSVFGDELLHGELDTATEIGATFLSVVNGSLNATLTESQQLLSGFIYLFLWLATIWLLRHLMAGKKVRVRDGLYNAGAPFVATLVIVMIGIVQLLPAAIGALVLAASQASGVAQGVELALFAVVAGLLLVLSLYWLTSTLFAVIIVTIPGTYPMAALKSAGDLVIGERQRVLYRMLWLGLVNLVICTILILPAILFDRILDSDWLSFTTLASQLATTAVIVFSSTYIYLLYRKIIDAKS